MGSLPKAEDDVRFVVTGFSSFDRVDKNPTEEVVAALPDFWKAGGKDEQRLYLCTTLKVTAATCDAFLKETAERVRQDLEGKTVVWLHLGVDVRAREMALECQAVNNASFQSPDEEKFQPDRESIDDRCPFQEVVRTKLDIDDLIGRLPSSNVPIRKSSSAGTFVCNWIYYRSLKLVQELGHEKWYSLFVHVPLFGDVSKDLQLKTVDELIDTLSKL